MGNLTRTLTFLQPWVGDSLTPYWVFCLGVALGLLVLLVLWGAATLLSKMPVIGALSEQAGPRAIAALVLAALFFVAAVVVLWPRISTSDAGGKELSDRYETIGLWLGLLAAGSVVAGFAGVMLVGRRAAAEVPLAIKEGVLLPIFIICLGLAAFGVVGVTTVKAPLDMLASLPRLSSMGVKPTSFDVEEANVPDTQEIPAKEIKVSMLGSEVQRLSLDSDEPLEVSLTPFDAKPDEAPRHLFKVPANEQFTWVKKVQAANPLPAGKIDKLYVRNLGASKANVRLTVLSSPPYPEIATVPIVAGAVCMLFLAYMLQRALFPKLSAVALATAKSEIAQPMFLLLLIGGIFLVLVFVYLPYNTFGEDIKMLKESGIRLIAVLGLVQAVWAAGNSVADEIDGRTALTVLSKPIGRREFILGKYLGIFWTVFLLSFVLSLAFLIAVGYKPIYDAKEQASEDVFWQMCHYEMLRVLPGLVLGLMEVSVLAALSVAISTRLPLLANFMICFAIYALGHLTPMIVQSGVGKFEIVAFFGNFIATLFPVLDHFDIQAAVTGGSEVPLEYLGWSLLYCLLYGALALLLALVMFEDRDLA